MTNGKYKLIALDMDGTLLNERAEVSVGNHQAIQAATAAGITVCLSTGRGFQSALPYAEELGLPGPMVTVNGGEVWRKPHELLIRHTMEAARIREMYRLARESDAWFWAYSTERVYNKSDWIDDEKLDAQTWLKFGYHTEDVPLLQSILNQLEQWGGLELSNSGPHNIEINPAGINKASGLAKVCGLLGITMSQVIAVGDSLNDTAMIQTAGLGVAMGNAQEEVKLLADWVTLSNEEDGVANVINEYLLK